MYLCFIDYMKTFDRVRREDVVQMQEKLNSLNQMLKVLRQRAAIRVINDLDEYLDIRRSVRQR